MSDPTAASPPSALESAATTYEDARVVVEPEALDHLAVTVSEREGHVDRFAVERVVVNSATVALGGTIWFTDATVDVGVPVDDHGDTVWIWV